MYCLFSPKFRKTSETNFHIVMRYRKVIFTRCRKLTVKLDTTSILTTHDAYLTATANRLFLTMFSKTRCHLQTDYVVDVVDVVDICDVC